MCSYGRAAFEVETGGGQRQGPAVHDRGRARVPNRLHNTGTFIEVFSGPNAPLSAAVCRKVGQELPGHRVESFRGVTNAKRIQLVLDGLHSCSLHLKEALQLRHPFRGETALKEDRKECLAQAALKGRRLSHHRLSVLAGWKKLATHESLLARQKDLNHTASTTTRTLGPLPNAALMEFLAERFGVEDRALPSLCLVGMPIVGEALISPFFEPYMVPAALTVQKLLSSAVQRRRATMRRVAFMAAEGGDAQAHAIYEKTLKEVQAGTMAGPFSEATLEARHGRHFNVIPSFGLQPDERSGHAHAENPNDHGRLRCGHDQGALRARSQRHRGSHRGHARSLPADSPA